MAGSARNNRGLAGKVKGWRGYEHLLGFLRANGSATLQAIDGQDWGDPDQGETGLVRTCRRLRRTLVQALQRNELVDLLFQRIGLPFVLALAIDMAERVPLSDCDDYPGQLLRATIWAGDGAWPQWPWLRDRLTIVLEMLDPVPAELADAYATFQQGKGRVR